MSAVHKLITNHLDIWTAADTEKKSGRGRASGNANSVYGIKKLRELILELAVRGKLVPQDPNDEPANILLEKIFAHKSELTLVGRQKKETQSPPIKEDEKRFTLPSGWEWIRFGDALINRDAERKPIAAGQRQDRQGLYDYYGASGVIDKIDEYLFDKPLLLIGEDGANLVNRSTPIAFIARGKYWVNNHAHVLDGVSEDYLRYIELFVNAIDLKPFVTGTAQPKMNQAKMNSIVLAIPPEEEQLRIVAKVDELMALCDQLEAQHNNAADAHEQLVSHLLSTLTQSQDAADFNANWQRIATHFDTLFTTESSIDALKQTLLQLAVMGKLVPQDPNDEPASELLKRIQDEKAKLVAEGTIKKDKAIASIDKSEIPFELPTSWEWARLQEITTGMDSGWSPACLENSSPSENVWGVLKTTSVQIMEYLEYENKELPANLSPRPDAEVKVGDILFTRAGPTNRVAISCFVKATRPKLMISDKIIRFHPIDRCVDGSFLTLCLNTGATAAFLEKAKSGMAASQVNISQEKLRLAPIPIPPLRLQREIVAKINKIMSLCDHLKSRIITSKSHQQKIADAMTGTTLV